MTRKRTKTGKAAAFVQNCSARTGPKALSISAACEETIQIAPATGSTRMIVCSQTIPSQSFTESGILFGSFSKASPFVPSDGLFR